MPPISPRDHCEVLFREDRTELDPVLGASFASGLMLHYLYIVFFIWLRHLSVYFSLSLFNSNIGSLFICSPDTVYTIAQVRQFWIRLYLSKDLFCRFLLLIFIHFSDLPIVDSSIFAGVFNSSTFFAEKFFFNCLATCCDTKGSSFPTSSPTLSSCRNSSWLKLLLYPLQLELILPALTSVSLLSISSVVSTSSGYSSVTITPKFLLGRQVRALCYTAHFTTEFSVPGLKVSRLWRCTWTPIHAIRCFLKVTPDQPRQDSRGIYFS